MRRTVGFCVKYEVACQFIKGGVQFVSGSCHLVYVSFSVLFNSCKAAIQGVPSSQWCSWWHAQLVSSRCRFPIWRVLAGLGELLSATAGCWGSSQSPVLQHFSCCPHCGVIQPGNRVLNITSTGLNLPEKPITCWWLFFLPVEHGFPCPKSGF